MWNQAAEAAAAAAAAAWEDGILGSEIFPLETSKEKPMGKNIPYPYIHIYPKYEGGFPKP